MSDVNLLSRAQPAPDASRGLSGPQRHQAPPAAVEVEPRALWRILDLNRQLGVPSDISGLLVQVIDAARDVLRAERGTVLLYEPQSRELLSAVATGSSRIRFSSDRGIAGQCARERRLINVPDCYADARFNPEIDRQTGYRTRCLLAVPLIGVDDSLVGVMQVLNKTGGSFDEHDERIAMVLASQCAIALQRAQFLEAQLVRQKLERDLALARDIQLRVLPKQLPQVPGYDLAGFSQPADETGGDIYDAVVARDGSCMLLLGDATGHGIGPALSVTQVRAMFRMAQRLDASLEGTFAHINSQLAADLGGDRFVTAFLGRLDTKGHVLEYQSGGQAPLLHYRARLARCEWLEATTIPLGILSEMPLEDAVQVRLEEGDCFVLVSDGIFECKNEQGECFSEWRVAEAVARSAGESAARIAEEIRRSVDEFLGRALPSDDMTVLAVRRL